MEERHHRDDHRVGVHFEAVDVGSAIHEQLEVCKLDPLRLTRGAGRVQQDSGVSRIPLDERRAAIKRREELVEVSELCSLTVLKFAQLASG